MTGDNGRRKPVDPRNSLFLAEIVVPHHRKADIARVADDVERAGGRFLVDQREALVGNAGIVGLADGNTLALRRYKPLHMGSHPRLILRLLRDEPDSGLPRFGPHVMDRHPRFIEPVDVNIGPVEPVGEENTNPGVTGLGIGCQPEEFTHYQRLCVVPVTVP